MKKSLTRRLGWLLSLFCVTAMAWGHGPHEATVELPPLDSPTVTACVRMGQGEATYESVKEWCQLPEGRQVLGKTHGGVAVDREGLIYFSMDDTDLSILVYSPAGKLVRSFDPKYSGIHGLCLNVEDGVEYLYAAHLRRQQVVKFKLDGTVVWTMGVPMASGKYKTAKQYKPTGVAVAPNGDIYVVDGYGQQLVHRFDKNQKYISSFGGRGSADGKFKTCHGVAIDQRGDEPMVLVCDRENRRLQHFDLSGKFVAVIATGLNRPCAVSFWGDKLAVAELEGRVTVLDKDNKVIAHLGGNEEKTQRANFNVPVSAWRDGIFTAPHGLSYDAKGNLYVMDWNRSGRISRLNHIAVDGKK